MAASGAKLARTLRERRRALGLTRTRLAERSGLSTPDIAKWERGEDLPDQGQIVALANAVDLDEAETQAWLDVVVSVDVTGPEVAVEIIDGGEPPANPFLERATPLRSKPNRLHRAREKMSRKPRTAPPVVAGLERPVTSTPTRNAPSPRTGLVAKPAGGPEREFAAVFPDSQTGSRDPAVRVYSTVPSTFPDPGDVQLYRLRRIRTASVLLGLGIILWWAFGALGEGFGDVLDLFRAPTENLLGS